MTETGPRHGTAWSYRCGCRCDQCRTAWTRKNKAWGARAYANGGSTTVDATELIPILQDLMTDRSQCAVADMIGASQSYVGRILRGDIKRVGIKRANQIRALQGIRTIPTTGAYVSAMGARRRLQALTALGYSTYALAARCHMSRTGLSVILNGDVDEIHGRTHHKLADAYERLSMQLPVGATISERSGITRARLRAQAAGWPPPLAWNDVDDENERPRGFNGISDVSEKERFVTEDRNKIDHNVINRILNGDRTPAHHATPAERREIVRKWPSTGRPINDLARLTGWKPERYGATA